MPNRLNCNITQATTLTTLSWRFAPVLAALMIATPSGYLFAQVEVPTDLTPVGVFTVRATEFAFTTEAGESPRFIESGGGFLWDNGTGLGGPAIGFDHFLAVPPNSSRPDDAAAYFSQAGIPILDDPDGGTFEFTRWAIDPPSETPPKPEETVEIFGIFSQDGEPVDFNDDGEITMEDEVPLSGFVFSDVPMGRDLIPAFTFDLFDDVSDPLVDHIEYVDTDWSLELVNDTNDFLVAQDIVTVAQADQISTQFVPEPSGGCLAWCATWLGHYCFRRRK